MEVYLLRHGIAEDGSPTGRDADRPLTDEGRRKLRDVLKLAAAGGVRPDLLVSSPYLRAKQTAEIAQEILSYKHDVTFTEALVPDSDPAAVWREIRADYSDSRSVMLA